MSPVAALRRSKNPHAPGMAVCGAGEGNRTLVVSLEGFCSTIELHPPGTHGTGPLPAPAFTLRATAKTLLGNLVEEVGFEPT